MRSRHRLRVAPPTRLISPITVVSPCSSSRLEIRRKASPSTTNRGCCWWSTKATSTRPAMDRATSLSDSIGRKAVIKPSSSISSSPAEDKRTPTRERFALASSGACETQLYTAEPRRTSTKPMPFSDATCDVSKGSRPLARSWTADMASLTRPHGIFSGTKPGATKRTSNVGAAFFFDTDGPLLARRNGCASVLIIIYRRRGPRKWIGAIPPATLPGLAVKPR